MISWLPRVPFGFAFWRLEVCFADACVCGRSGTGGNAMLGSKQQSGSPPALAHGEGWLKGTDFFLLIFSSRGGALKPTSL